MMVVFFVPVGEGEGLNFGGSLGFIFSTKRVEKGSLQSFVPH